MSEQADPTPQEIAERAAAIRAEWTPEIERKRRCGGNRIPWVLPGAKVDRKAGAVPVAADAY